ncbi:protein-glutamate methylesterase/protein-glutamine glutaminase [Desulfovirgula thermocuniculi]|uniref:protein-glutamate methylesterase/protein-glutamine glutaminase n=1 Tax=Desulfovirgula thermocuniculi TaxID=348842 RepID=UPI0003FC160B|nr:chemotaxis response regulator protein-glutamate methylesterase [Desulfovirgula thermocuniculi]
MAPVRVLIVDDSALLRRLLTRFLEGREGFQVIGTAADGEEAVQKTCSLAPDVVTLDLEMPVLDGLGALRRIMRECPAPVVMLSSHTTAGARATMQALALGAVDFVAKPSRPGQWEAVVDELAEKLRAAARVGVHKLTDVPRRRKAAPPPPPPAAEPEHPRPAPPSRRTAAPVEVVVIGSSTGGPAALQAIIPALPRDFPAAVVVVQHLPVGFSQSLAEHLDRRSSLPVKHAAEGDEVLPGQVLVAPAGFEFTFRRRGAHVAVHLDAGSGPPPPGTFRPSVDAAMVSAAEVYGERSVGVLLTGMGRDGARGMMAIKEKGGLTIAQDEATCVVFGMPRAAIELGAAQKVLPLDRIPEEVIRAVTHPRAAGQATS